MVLVISRGFLSDGELVRYSLPHLLLRAADPAPEDRAARGGAHGGAPRNDGHDQGRDGPGVRIRGVQGAGDGPLGSMDRGGRRAREGELTSNLQLVACDVDGPISTGWLWLQGMAEAQIVPLVQVVVAG